MDDPRTPTPDTPQDDLTDDLYQVLTTVVTGWEAITGYDLSTSPPVVRVIARYRQERGDIPS